jgi:hypothetical protein
MGNPEMPDNTFNKAMLAYDKIIDEDNNILAEIKTLKSRRKFNAKLYEIWLKVKTELISQGVEKNNINQIEDNFLEKISEILSIDIKWEN